MFLLLFWVEKHKSNPLVHYSLQPYLGKICWKDNTTSFVWGILFWKYQKKMLMTKLLGFGENFLILIEW